MIYLIKATLAIRHSSRSYRDEHNGYANQREILGYHNRRIRFKSGCVVFSRHRERFNGSELTAVHDATDFHLIAQSTAKRQKQKPASFLTNMFLDLDAVLSTFPNKEVLQDEKNCTL